MRVSWLENALRDAGLPVIVTSGAYGRGGELSSVDAVVLHDTVTPGWSDDSVTQLLIKGRTDLKGPLAQLGMQPDGALVLIADGRCSHNGYGAYGNDSIGIEVYCAGGYKGKEQPYNGVQREHAARASAAILAYVGLDAGRCLGHKETDPNRKVDPYGVDMGEMRADVARYLAGAAPEPEVTLLMSMATKRDADNRRWVFGIGTDRKVYAYCSEIASEPFILDDGSGQLAGGLTVDVEPDGAFVLIGIGDPGEPVDERRAFMFVFYPGVADSGSGWSPLPGCWL